VPSILFCIILIAQTGLGECSRSPARHVPEELATGERERGAVSRKELADQGGGGLECGGVLAIFSILSKPSYSSETEHLLE
jgi:hypothetical protein